MLWVGSNKTANVLRIQAIYKPEIVFGDSSQNGFFSMKFLFKLQLLVIRHYAVSDL